jgi:hypothetical protein
MTYPPDRLANLWRAGAQLIPHAAIAGFIAVSSWSAPAKIAGVTLTAFWLLLGFPRHYFLYSLETRQDRLIYVGRTGERKEILWQDVTHYYLGFGQFVLLDGRRPYPFLLGRPFLIQGKRAFIAEVVERCAGASRIGRTEYWKRLWASVRWAIRSGQNKGQGS